jgi:RHS repeat-associated protein
MVEQNRSNVYSQIVYAPSGGKLAIMSGQTLQKAFVPLSGGSVAVYNSSGLAYYRHSDWVGSSRFASTPARALYFDGAYAPFGENYAQTGTTDLSFTGMNQDTVSNLFDFPAREYNGIHGRWPSPDPAGIGSLHPGDPQSLNRYAYVRNNPLRLTDPSGLDSIEDDPSFLGEVLFDDGGGGDGGGGGGDDGDITSTTTCDESGCSNQTTIIVNGNDPATNGDPNASPCDSNDAACNSQLQQALSGGRGGVGQPQTRTCTAAQQAAATLAKSFDNASQTTGWIALGFGFGTAVAGAGEGVSLGLDTPVTITFGSATGFFATSSFLTGSAAAVLNSFASGNVQSMLDFNWSQLTNVAATAAASKIPGVGPWAETVGNLAEQGRDMSTNAAEACTQ